MEKYKKFGLLCIFILLVAMNASLLRLDIVHSRRILTFAMLDIGQGDALFVESPSGAQILLDAGPPRKILGQLERVMSPFDHALDAVVITNPDADHIGGFSDVLKNYKVGYVLESGTENDSKTFKNLKNEVRKRSIPNIVAKKGMKIHMGGAVVMDILFPDRDVSGWSTNDGSIVARLSYGSTSILLTGDATSETEKIVLDSGENLGSKILKIGHHGSHSSTSYAFLKAVRPAYALISSGRGNSYGHPHEEVLKALKNFGVKVFRTDTLGTIIMKSDGKKESFSFVK